MLNNKIMVTAKHLPSLLNIQAELKPRPKTKFLERKGNALVF